MALNKTNLKTALKSAFTNEMPSPTSEQLAAYDRIADAFANAIDAFVKSGTVTVTVATGIPVATTGTAAAQTGATTTTGTGTGTIE